MGKNIDDGSKKLFVLDKYADDDLIHPAASEFRVLLLYFITLACDDDNLKTKGHKDYLILDYGGYTDTDCEDVVIRDGIWSVPYISLRINEEGMLRRTRVGSIKRLYEEQLQEKKERIRELELQLFYKLGIFDCKKNEGNHYIEYKPEENYQHNWRCFYIQEYFLSNIDPQGIKNLSDPEGLGMHRYFPLNNWWREENEKILFQGKFIPENVGQLIRSPATLIRHENYVRREDLYHKVKGYLFKIDIIGFTDTYNYILENCCSLEKRGEEIAGQYIAKIAGVFEQELQSAGISQYIIEGDGITASLPSNRSIQNLDRILSTFTEIQKGLSNIVKNIERKVNVRCTVLYSDNYIYGKLSGFDALRPGFSGEALIKLSRMDQWLHDFIYSHEIVDSESAKIVLGVDSECDDGYNKLLTERGYSLKKQQEGLYRGADINMECFVR
ncbi:MAG: hypothetical protein LUH55_11285 [Bacteroides thetaiotaomicron]|nr:hypothetical protein [Bacteroides thetaiotaomicron]